MVELLKGVYRIGTRADDKNSTMVTTRNMTAVEPKVSEGTKSREVNFGNEEHTSSNEHAEMAETKRMEVM